MNASRERKLKFMRDFGTFALRDAVVAAFDRQGPAFLTDEQLDAIVECQVSDRRFTAKLNRRSRAIYAARHAAAADPAQPKNLIVYEDGMPG